MCARGAGNPFDMLCPARAHSPRHCATALAGRFLPRSAAVALSAQQQGSRGARGHFVSRPQL